MAEVNINVTGGCGCKSEEEVLCEELESIEAAINNLAHKVGQRLHTLTQEVHRLAQLIEAQGRTIAHNQEEVMDQLDDLVAKVTEIEGVEASTEAALQGLSDYIRSHTGIDPAVRAAIVDRLSGISTRLAAAVAANQPPATPATPA